MRSAKLRRRLRRMFDNAGAGLEYNQFSRNRRVSRNIYDVDIASNPRIVKEGPNGFIFCNVLDRAEMANSEGHLINGCKSLVEGRS